MALDQATAQLARGFAGMPALETLTPGEARALAANLVDVYGPGPDVFSTQDVEISPAGVPIRVRMLMPVESPRGVIVFYHGGGWVTGTLEEYDTIGRVLAVRTGCTVALVDYRLAPETPFPGPVQDAYGALAWVAHHADDVAAPGAPLIVMGDSAGGNLAAVVALKARTSGPAIGAQVLIYPVIAANFETPSYQDPDNEVMLSRGAMKWFWDLYTPMLSDRDHVDASPLAADPVGAPPAVVLTAEHDVLRSEGEAYVEKLRAAGVPVGHRRFEGQMHGFFTFFSILPSSEAAVQYIQNEIEYLFVPAPQGGAV